MVTRMDSVAFTAVFIFAVLCCSPAVLSQQPYVGEATSGCDSSDSSKSILGYTCNGFTPTCQAYLTFRSQPPYNSVSAISTFFSADPLELSQLNSVPQNATFPTNKLVLIPRRCSCSGDNYQANTNYTIHSGDTLLWIANTVFQGLSTCQAIQHQNNITGDLIFAGMNMTVPLRCACPTRNQTNSGVKYLLSYLIIEGNSVFDISERFDADNGLTLEANGLPALEPTIYPNTTLLVPLKVPPTSSDTVEEPPPPPSAPLPPVPSSGGSSSKSKTWIYVLVGVLAAACLAVTLGSIVFFKVYRKRRKEKTAPVVDLESFEAYEKRQGKKLQKSVSFSKMITSLAQSVKVYNFTELQNATDNFSPSYWIGGSVYRGMINKDLAAIKKVDADVSNEISLLNKINHSNIVRVFGVSFNEGHWYVVYEYAANGPLSDWIYFNNIDGKFLSWTQRIQIALDVATGLNYLHCFTSPSHVHKNLNSGNVLLDSDLRAKIANFSLAKSAEGEDGEFALTRHIVGTRGYMAPEYLENGLVSDKLDVYAFGILMLEMLSGKEVSSFYSEENINISNVLHTILDEEDREDKLKNFMDPSLKKNYSTELGMFVIKLVDSCLKKDPSGRPSMDEIVQSLSLSLNTSYTWEMSASAAGENGIGDKVKNSA